MPPMSKVRCCPQATSVAFHEPSPPTSEVLLLVPMLTLPPTSNALASASALASEADADTNADDTSDEARRRRPSLRRGLAHLVKGMRGVVLSLTLLFGALLGILLWTSTLSTSKSAIDGNEWKCWHFVAQIVATTSSLTMLILLGLAANVLLYMYCKAVQGELAMEIAKEFSRESVSLPFDNEKVPHVVSVAYA